MIRYFKKNKCLKILVIIGLLCPATDNANELVIAFCKKYVIDVIAKKVSEKALEYLAGSALMASFAVHLKAPSNSLVKSDWDYAQQFTKDTKQALTPAVKTVAKKISLEVTSHAAKEVIRKNVVLPAPLNVPVAPKTLLNSPSHRRATHSCTLIGRPTPTVTFAVANTQNIVSKTTSDIHIAPSSTLTRIALKQVIINKASQNSATPPSVTQVAQIPSPSQPVTHTFKQSTSNFNARTQHSNTSPMFTVRAEAIPLDRTYQDDGKSIIRQAELAHQIQRFTANNKTFLDEIQRKLNIASQQSLKPQVIKEQLELVSHSIPQYNLNAELSVRKGMMFEHYFDRNGEFQGCLSKDKQEQLTHYANGDLRTWSYSRNRLASWFVDKIKNLWSSKKDLIEQISTNPYNLNLYNFALQFDAKNCESSAHFLNLIRPDHAFDNCNKCTIYKNMYDSFITQFYDAKNPLVLADKVSSICKDHPNPVIRTIFNQLFNENITFKKYAYPYLSNYQDIQIPTEITTQKYTNLRTLYLKLTALQPTDQQKIEHIRQGLLYIKEACSEKQHANIFSKLAHSIYQQIISKSDTTILHCRNFAQSFSSSEAQQIQQEVLPFISKATDILQSVPTNPLDNTVKLGKQCAQEILTNANILYDALAHGDLPKARFIKEHILPNLTPEYVKAHGNSLEALRTSAPANTSSFFLPQQLLAAKLVASVPSVPTPINSLCSIEDKSKNLQQPPNQCMPEVKIPTPECPTPPEIPTIAACAAPRFESEAERRINAEIEASQNKRESGEESRGRQCNWSQGNNLLSFKEQETSKTPSDMPKSENNKVEIYANDEKRDKITEDNITQEKIAKICKENIELQRLKQIIENLKKITLDIRYGKLENRVTDANRYLKELEKSEKMWENSRKNNADIEEISKNTGIPVEIIQQIKNHLFHEEHILFNGTVGKFLTDPDIVEAWNRLRMGNFVQSDLKLLLHEYAESLIMKGKEISWEKAHPLINSLYDWQNFY